MKHALALLLVLTACGSSPEASPLLDPPAAQAGAPAAVAGSSGDGTAGSASAGAPAEPSAGAPTVEPSAGSGGALEVAGAPATAGAGGSAGSMVDPVIQGGSGGAPASAGAAGKPEPPDKRPGSIMFHWTAGNPAACTWDNQVVVWIAPAGGAETAFVGKCKGGALLAWPLPPGEYNYRVAAVTHVDTIKGSRLVIAATSSDVNLGPL